MQQSFVNEDVSQSIQLTLNSIYKANSSQEETLEHIDIEEAISPPPDDEITDETPRAFPNSSQLQQDNRLNFNQENWVKHLYRNCDIWEKDDLKLVG